MSKPIDVTDDKETETATDVPMTATDYAAQAQLELEKIQRYHEAVRTEWAKADADDVSQSAKARNLIMPLVPDAANQISTLMKFSESDSIRANLSKWVMEQAMRADDKGGAKDEMEKLFQDLMADAGKTGTSNVHTNS